MHSREGLIVIGGTGFVGAHVASCSPYLTTIVARGELEAPASRQADFIAANITDSGAISSLVESRKPAIVVNTAAISDIDYAENHRELAHAVNVEGATTVAEASRRCGAHYLFLSSDAVFDGEAEAYSEADEKAPVNYYGRTKAEAEQAVLAANPTASVVRVSLVLGSPVREGNSFVAALAGKIAAGTEINAPTFEWRTPVDVYTLVSAILELAERRATGIWHIACTEAASRYDLTLRLVSGMGGDASLVRPLNAPPETPDRAPRHRNGILRVGKAQRELATPMHDLEGTITRALAPGRENGVQPEEGRK